MILIVEDEPVVRKMLAEVFARKGHTVYVADDGEHALTMLDSGLRPRIIITDIVMPRMDGNRFIEEVHKRGNDIPIVILTAYLDSVRQEYMDSLLVVPKPPDCRKLLELVEQWEKPVYPAEVQEDVQ